MGRCRGSWCGGSGWSCAGLAARSTPSSSRPGPWAAMLAAALYVLVQAARSLITGAHPGQSMLGIVLLAGVAGGAPGAGLPQAAARGAGAEPGAAGGWHAHRGRCRPCRGGARWRGRGSEQIGREGVHDHAEQFLAADAFAAQDADDGVVAGGLEVAGLAADGDLEQVVDEAGGEGFGSSSDFGVAVEPGCVWAGVAVFALEVVEQLDEVALLGVGAPGRVSGTSSTEMLVGTCRLRESSRCRQGGGTGTLAAIPSPADSVRRGGA